MNHSNRLVGIAGVVLCVAAMPSAWAQDQFKSISSDRGETIVNDRGGYLVDYAARLAQFQKGGQKVNFAGRCNSACTLFLALPQNQTCITPGASFGFHAPKAPTLAAAEVGQLYLVQKYPSWVQSLDLKSRRADGQSGCHGLRIRQPSPQTLQLKVA